MGKERNTYRTYNTSILKGRSDIPSAGNIAEHTGHIDCTNISLNAVKSLLGASTYSLYDLCRHANVNHWSGYGPTVRDTTNEYTQSAALVNTDPTTCRLGDFAGYDHSAPTPGWNTDPQGSNIMVNSGSQAAIPLDVCIGQVKYEDLGGVNVIGVLTDASDNVRGWGRIALSSCGDSANITVNTDSAYYVGGITLDQNNMKLKAYIDDGYTIESASDVVNGLLCRVPGTDDAGVNIIILHATDWGWNTVGNYDPPSPWVESGASGWNSTTSEANIGVLNASSDQLGITIKASLYSQEDGLIDSYDIFVGDYYAPDGDLTGSHVLGSPPIGSYGYYMIFTIEQSS